MEKKKKNWLYWPLGLAVGLLNGLFGSGGGIAAVPMLRGMGLTEEEAHANSIAIILPLAALSGWIYLRNARFAVGDALPYLPGGLAGAIAGALLLPQLKALWLRRIFGAVILFSAGMLLLR